MKKLLILFAICSLAITAYGQDDTYYTGDEATVTIKAQIAPPQLLVYTQPMCPGDGYIWVPGYWAWGTGGYYWVAGVWVMPPDVDLLWTPGYWGFYGGYYGWHGGYWGGSVGYYGGVNYGFGYYGSGFYGGRWEGGHFHYNTAVWRVGGGVHNTYVSHDGVRSGGAHASYNGPGGVKYHPAAHEQAAMHGNHVAPTKEHTSHEQNMGTEKGQFHSPTTRPATHSMSVPGGQRYNERGRTITPSGGSAPRGGGAAPRGGGAAPRGGGGGGGGAPRGGGGGGGAPHGGGGGGKH